MYFEYFNDQSPQLNDKKDFFIVDIPPSISLKEEIFSEFYGQFLFKDLSGFNWDAMLDCLRDLSWIEQYSVVIRHADVPLLTDRHECEIYLDILRTAVIDWRMPPKENVISQLGGWPFVDHRLRVLFPDSLRPVVESMLPPDTGHDLSFGTA